MPNKQKAQSRKHRADGKAHPLLSALCSLLSAFLDYPFQKQQCHSDGDERVCDIEDGKRSHLKKIRHKSVAQTIQNICECTAEYHPESNMCEKRLRGPHCKNCDENKCCEDQNFLESRRELQPECDAGIQCRVKSDELTDNGNTLDEIDIGKKLRGEAKGKTECADKEKDLHEKMIYHSAIARYTPCPNMFRRIDFLLLGITIVLTFFGLAMIASVSVFESYQITQRLTDEGLRAAPTNSFYLWRSFLHIVVGMSAMAVMIVLPYKMWQRLARPLFLLSIVLLMALFIPGISAGYGSAASWLRLGPLSLQPSELLKITLIFYLAVWLQKREQLIGTFKEGFIPFVSLLVLSTLLVAIQPDLGSFFVIAGIACVMFFIAGGNLFHLLMGGGAAALLGLPIILNKEYVRARFMAFLNPTDPNISETIGFQIKQALIAIGSGGFFGVGYGKSIQKFGYLPEVQADMVFSAMAEELGFFRVMLVLLMYSILVIRGYKIAQEAPDRFGFMVATGITTWIAFQTIVNLAVNLSLFPLTGLTLPFISYGGSSLVSILIGVGVLLNISMHSTEEASMARRARKTKVGIRKLFA